MVWLVQFRLSMKKRDQPNEQERKYREFRDGIKTELPEVHFDWEVQNRFLYNGKRRQGRTGDIKRKES